MQITTLEQLRALYAAPGERALRKQLSALDAHCRRFVSLAPFMVLATSDARGRLDASPRGGEPGFVRIAQDGALLIPDAPGNNRLDSLENLIAHPEVGLLFMIPGVDETLRVNGAATLSVAQDDLAAFAGERRTPKLAIRVCVRETYLHCAKALMRSRLWDPQACVERSVLPTMNEMIRDQAGLQGPLESQADMVRRYADDL